MCRQVTLEIDMARFSEAFRTMSGDEAKQVLVMLVCGGHASDSHSGCLRDVGVNPAETQGKGRSAETNARIAASAEDFLERVGQARPSDILDGLADRPRPGSKARARREVTSLLGAIYGLRKDVAWSKPLKLVPSGGQPAPAA